MNETLKTFTDDLAKQLKAAFAEQKIGEFVATTKASDDDRTFEVVMSTSDEDRQGDELDQSKWDFKYFDMNPVLLWAHNYQGFPIGIVTDIQIEGNKAIATGKFAPAGVNPEADMTCALYQAKVLRAVSPGYIQNDDGTRELLELSFCPVPAGKYALSLRQVRALGVSTRELVTKGFFYDDSPPTKKAQQAGDACELEDGTPGVLGEDDKNPGTLICIPSKSKAETMKETLKDKFKAEHERHGKTFAKAIDEFKGIDEFEKSIDGEQDEHLEKCMKAIDEGYELEDQKPEKKSIDEFKKSVEDEHLTHVKACDKAIDEFKSAHEAADGDDEKQKSIDEFTKAIGDELDRHEKAHMDLCENAMGEGEDEEKAGVAKFFAAFIEEATSLGMDKSQAERLLDWTNKSGRTISAKSKEKIAAVIKALEAHHEEHEKSTNDVIASLKELMGSPQDDEGEEQKPDEKSGAAPKPRSSPSKSAQDTDAPLSEFEAYMFSRRVLKAVYQASGEGLTRIAKELREKFPDRR